MKKLWFLTFLLSTSVFSADKLTVNWNCYLPGDVLECDALKAAFLSGNSDVNLGTGIAAKIALSIRSVKLSSTTEYKFKFDGADKLPDIEWPLTLNSSLSSGEITERIMKTLGNLISVYRTALGQVTQESNDETVNYYVEPKADGSLSKKQGYKSSYGSLNVVGNYSTPKWRVVGSGYAENYNEAIEETAYNQGLKTKTIWVGGDMAVIRSFSKHWDVAILANDNFVDTDISTSEIDPSIPENALKNRSSRFAIKAGVEWLAVPFIEENSNGNIAIRYSLGKEFHKYVDPTTFEYVRETFLRHSVTVAANRHFNKADVTFSLQAYKSSMREKPITGMKGTAGISYKVTPRLSIGASYSMEYAKNRVASPADSGLSFANLTSDDKSAFAYSGSVSLKFTLGNSRLFGKEQRWKK
jgi:hypothetical protein